MSDWFSPFTGSRPADFKYPPLDASRKAFRLIRLLPPRPSLIPGWSDTIRIEIHEASIDASSTSSCLYDALSYVWGVSGGQKANRMILVESGDKTYKLRIHRPLEVALLHLVANNVTHLPLFVDQICIDQDSTNEKEHQVSLMKDVYANCDRAIIWLGSATRNSDLWFNFVRDRCSEGTLGGLLGPRVKSFMTVFDAVMDPAIEVAGQERDDRDAILASIRNYGDQFPLDGYKDILERKWFGRLWTIQEACLAPRVVMACGKHVLCYDCFRAGMLFYNLYNTHWVRNLTEAQPKSDLRRRSELFDKSANILRMVQERKTIHQTGDRLFLYDLVLKYNVNDFKTKIGASLAVDRIFGLLGLGADNDNFRQRLRVLYDKEDENAGVISTYTEAAALMLGENVDMLLFNQHPKKVEGLPSWVPDWSMNLTTPVGYASLRESVYTAGGSKEGSSYWVDEETRQLTINGVLFDRVVRVGERTYSDDAVRSVEREVDYRSSKLFFDEIGDFVREAAVTFSAGASSDSPPDGQAQAQQLLRVSDSGLSQRHFAAKFGSPAGIDRLQSQYDFIYKLGERQLKSDAFIASYSITRIYRTVGVIPWYFTPPSESDALGVWARGPVPAATVAYQGLTDLLEDIVGLCCASARVKWAVYYIWFRNRFGKRNVKVDPVEATKAGLPKDFMETREERAAFTEHILKNVGRRVYRTAMGYVGMGPPQIKSGDAVVVFHGGTMPHILRETNGMEMNRGGETWQYVGEAYCDGIMDGESLEGGVVRDFTLV
ncbi:hypothetical protein QQS21_011369 [Conoideocrella luteorostrata]|uniref:Heterokaryon incompatibility domain-containing protein n=1 Tax=Conoideocrella luteorostrata TaxID=1105319 RepID=A0AAJ0CDJ5_9HYPO|nr:hypothetical protein QQS21_011369 [Conoideocrella luteorostrata]